MTIAPETRREVGAIATASDTKPAVDRSKLMMPAHLDIAPPLGDAQIYLNAHGTRIRWVTASDYGRCVTQRPGDFQTEVLS